MVFALALGLVALGRAQADETAPPTNHRKPADDAQLRYWLENMIWFHRFTREEIASATGLEPDAIAAAIDRFHITASARPQRRPADPLRVMPYPGGRHPRIGFLEGAVRPQRDTKISVFTPWDETSYVVADIPEAIWSNLGLTYLAHTHVPTIWTKQNVDLEPLEWARRADGTLDFERRLPNGIRFGTKVIPSATAVLMEMWLTNGTPGTLTDLRVQNCVMLKAAKGFEEQTVGNKVLAAPLDRGEQLTESVFSLPPSGLIMPRNKLAVAVPIGSMALINGRIKPGDYVTVFVTLTPGKDGKNVTRAILRRVLVLAAEKAGKNQSGDQSDKASLTLAVSPTDAEKLVFISNLPVGQGTIWAGLWPPGAKSLPESGGQNLDSLY